MGIFAELVDALELSVICIETARQAIHEAGGYISAGGPIDEHLEKCRAVLERAREVEEVSF